MINYKADHSQKQLVNTD